MLTPNVAYIYLRTTLGDTYMGMKSLEHPTWEQNQKFTYKPTPSLTKQPTFRNDTNWFPWEMTSGERLYKSHTDYVSLPRPG